jgi:hypothetical protein
VPSDVGAVEAKIANIRPWREKTNSPIHRAASARPRELITERDALRANLDVSKPPAHTAGPHLTVLKLCSIYGTGISRRTSSQTLKTANIGTFGPLSAAIGAKEARCSAPGVCECLLKRGEAIYEQRSLSGIGVFN